MNKVYKDNSIKIIMIILLVAIICASSYYLFSNLFNQNKENDEFKELENIIKVTDENNVVEEQNLTNEEEKEDSNVTYYSIDLSSLKSKNNDLVGWIKVDGTNINYPVMQNGQYYLKKNFYKNNSQLGTPFLAQNCNIKTSDNLIIYGHHIKTGLMFADIDKYKNYNFYKNHKYIKFYTLENEKTKENLYEICFAFKTVANSNGFNYYSYTRLDSNDYFSNFVESCRNIELYNTYVETNLGDKFLTLSTCEYSQKDGRMVIVGRKIY